MTVSAIAQQKPSKSEVDSFRLSMEKVRATATALKGFMQLLETDPQLRERFKAASEGLEDTNGRDSVSMAAAVLEAKEPRIAALYRKAGITPKEAGMTMEAIVGLVLGDAMLEATKTKTELPAGMVAENMAFYRQNKAEIMQIFQQLQESGRKLAPEAEKDEEK